MMSCNIICFNSYVENGILFIKPTLTVDRYIEEFLKSGYLDLIEEGCDPRAADKRCVLYIYIFGMCLYPYFNSYIHIGLQSV